MDEQIKHKTDPNLFCYVCGEYTILNRLKAISPMVKLIYERYFGFEINAGIDVPYAPNRCCENCYRGLMHWFNGKSSCMPFGTPMLWAPPPADHIEEICYFCMVDIPTGHNLTMNSLISYPDLEIAIRPMAHSETIPIPSRFSKFSDRTMEIVSRRKSMAIEMERMEIEDNDDMTSKVNKKSKPLVNDEIVVSPKISLRNNKEQSQADCNIKSNNKKPSEAKHNMKAKAKKNAGQFSKQIITEPTETIDTEADGTENDENLNHNANEQSATIVNDVIKSKRPLRNNKAPAEIDIKPEPTENDGIQMEVNMFHEVKEKSAPTISQKIVVSPRKSLRSNKEQSQADCNIKTNNKKPSQAKDHLKANKITGLNTQPTETDDTESDGFENNYTEADGTENNYTGADGTENYDNMDLNAIEKSATIVNDEDVIKSRRPLRNKAPTETESSTIDIKTEPTENDGIRMEVNMFHEVKEKSTATISDKIVVGSRKSLRNNKEQSQAEDCMIKTNNKKASEAKHNMKSKANKNTGLIMTQINIQPTETENYMNHIAIEQSAPIVNAEDVIKSKRPLRNNKTPAETESSTVSIKTETTVNDDIQMKVNMVHEIKEKSTPTISDKIVVSPRKSLRNNKELKSAVIESSTPIKTESNFTYPDMYESVEKSNSIVSDGIVLNNSRRSLRYNKDPEPAETENSTFIEPIKMESSVTDDANINQITISDAVTSDEMIVNSGSSLRNNKEPTTETEAIITDELINSRRILRKRKEPIKPDVPVVKAKRRLTKAKQAEAAALLNASRALSMVYEKDNSMINAKSGMFNYKTAIKKIGKSYCCKLCAADSSKSHNKKFFQLAALRQHIKFKHFKLRFDCNAKGYCCAAKFFNPTRLREHYQRQHCTNGPDKLPFRLIRPAKKPRVLTEEQIKLANEKLLKKSIDADDVINYANLEIKAKEYYRCRLCPETSKNFTSQTGLRNHIKTQHYHFRYECPECLVLYTTCDAYKKHYENDHFVRAKVKGKKNVTSCLSIPINYKRVEMQMYQIKFQYKNAFEQLGDKFICKLCPSENPCKYNNKCSVQEHIKLKHYGLRYKCSECSKDFSKLKFVKQHYLKKHNKEAPPIIEKFLTSQKKDSEDEAETEVSSSSSDEEDAIDFDIKHLNKDLSFADYDYDALPMNCMEIVNNEMDDSKDFNQLAHMTGTDAELPNCSILSTADQIEFTEFVQIKNDYLCTVCNSMPDIKLFKYANEDAVREHIKKQHYGYRYVCAECDLKYSKVKHILNHYETAHKTKASDVALPCLVDVRKYFKPFYYNRNPMQQLDDNSYICKLCSMQNLETHNSYTDMTALQSHIKFKHLTFRYKCSECTAEYLNINGLKKHYRRRHYQKKPPKTVLRKTKKRCEQIDYSNLIKQVDGKFICAMCPAETATNSSNINNVQAHVKMKHLGFKYICGDCDVGQFTYRDMLQSHYRKVHEKEPPKYLEYNVPKVPVPVAAPEPSKNIVKPKIDFRILKKQLPDNSYICTLCPEDTATKFQNKLSVNAHIKVDHYNYRFICTECDAQFIYRSILQSHYRKKHDKVPPTNLKFEVPAVLLSTTSDKIDFKNIIKETEDGFYYCDLCPEGSAGTLFSGFPNVRGHIKTQHYGFRFLCPDCNDNYTYRSSLCAHIRKVHNREPPAKLKFDIPAAGLATNKIDFKNLIKETEDGNFYCDLCPEGSEGSLYNAQINVHAHIKTQHYGYRFLCPDCDANFMYRNPLRTHIRKVHKKPPPVKWNFGIPPVVAALVAAAEADAEADAAAEAEAAAAAEADASDGDAAV